MISLSGKQRREQRSKRWSKFPEDVLPLWIADMDYVCAPEIKDALQKYSEEECYGYRFEPLEAASVVVEHLKQRFDWSVKEEDIVWIPSARAALNIGCEIMGSDKVCIPTPIYPPFLFAPASAGREHREVHCVDKKLDISGIDDVLSRESCCLLFCNPHNPIGRVYSRAELEELAEVICRNNAEVVSDEVHALVILDEDKKHIPLASLNDDIANRTVTTMGPGKPFNIAGLCCAYAVIQNKELRERFRAEVERRIVEVAPMSFFALIAAYTRAAKWQKECLEYLRENQKLLCEEVNKIEGLSVEAAEGTFLAWINCEALKLKDIEAHYLDKKLGIIPAEAFGSTNHFRLNFACSRENISEAVSRMA